jgi:hypothetical protein
MSHVEAYAEGVVGHQNVHTKAKAESRMECGAIEETKLGQPFYAPSEKRFKSPRAGETKAYSISLLLYTGIHPAQKPL